jgi:hypothetical protein
MLDEGKIEEEAKNFSNIHNNDVESFIKTTEIKVDVNDILELNCDNDNNHSNKYFKIKFVLIIFRSSKSNPNKRRFRRKILLCSFFKFRKTYG